MPEVAGRHSNLRRKRLCRPKGRKGDYRASRSGHAPPVTKRQSSDWTGPAPRHPTNRRPGQVLGNRQRSVSRDYKSAEAHAANVLLRPLGTLSGRLTLHQFDGCLPTCHFSGQALVPTSFRVSGRLLLMALCKGTDGYALASGKLPFMRDSRESIEVVKGFSDPQVEATLKAIQEVPTAKSPRTGPAMRWCWRRLRV